MRRSAVVALAAGALLIILLFALVGRGEREQVPRLDGEPAVHLVDKASGSVRELTMEEYIKGVVAGEMGNLPTALGEGAEWPPAAYQAQAILARSFALSFLGDDGIVRISTDVEEAQAYAPEKVTPAIEQAVRETRGVVMAHNGGYVKAWFHSYSGGHTATAKEGLNYKEKEPGFLQAKPTPDNPHVPAEYRAWSASIPIDRVTAALAERGVNVGRLQRVEVVERGPSGRATKLNLTGSAGSGPIHAADFRIAVDPEVFRSTLLESLRVEGDRLVASGKGFGHGVGLSQWDAFALAEEGRSAEEILKFFFKDIAVGPAWE